jgi:hypothetical protein
MTKGELSGWLLAVGIAAAFALYFAAAALCAL